LSGSFRLVPGSRGAGNESYTLRLRNHGHAACTVASLPSLRLLDENGLPLPTHPFLATGRRHRVVIAAGRSVSATARFSPDVPGPGEANRNPCEPGAHALRIFLPGGPLTVRVRPSTSVCEHGTMSFSAL
jgi:hypothetical protein